MYPLQLFLGSYSEKKFREIRFDSSNSYNHKPLGGLWTSSLINGNDSEWIKWLKQERYAHHSARSRVGTILKANENIKIYKPKVDNPPVDFERLSLRYDAIWWRHGRSHGFWWAWDVESTLWLHPSFEVVEKIPIVVNVYENGYGEPSEYAMSAREPRV